jgi:hypothetical protein
MRCCSGEKYQHKPWKKVVGSPDASGYSASGTS